MFLKKKISITEAVDLFITKIGDSFGGISDVLAKNNFKIETENEVVEAMCLGMWIDSLVIWDQSLIDLTCAAFFNQFFSQNTNYSREEFYKIMGKSFKEYNAIYYSDKDAAYKFTNLSQHALKNILGEKFDDDNNILILSFSVQIKTILLLSSKFYKEVKSNYRIIQP